MEARRFPRDALATAHYLASATGVSILAGGGDAVDAAVAAKPTLGGGSPDAFRGGGGPCPDRPAWARPLERRAADGRDAYYKGRIGDAIVATLAEHGGAMRRGDLATHVGEWTTPLRAPYRDIEVAELPPPTQGVTALEALRILDGLPDRHDPVDREHLRIEALKQALADRDQYVTDPDHMPGSATDLLAASWIEARRRGARLDRATHPPPRGTPARAAAPLVAPDRHALLRQP